MPGAGWNVSTVFRAGMVRSRRVIPPGLARLTGVLPVGGKFRKRDCRLVRYRVEEAGQARAAVQAGLVVPLGQGVHEEYPFLVGGGLGERRVPGTMSP
jgi:hypothetical protein